ncbi:MAG: cyclase family protein [Bryobacterales bacterium]|nr:cyclase family protein [Bryobacterales bacterium]
MSAWIDITQPLRVGMPQWPGDPPFTFQREVYEGVSLTTITMCAHTGTHVDAPLHYLDGGAAIDAMPLDALIGPARIVDSDWVEPAERVLIRTRPGQDEIAVEQALQLVDAGAKLVGIDSLSIGDAEVHQALLAAGVVILEGLDLRGVEPGEYDLVCLPLKLEGADGAPARVVVRPRR